MKTDGSVNHRGFNATYTTACGGELNADTDGVIISPGYPNTPRFEECTWVISSEFHDRRVSLTFLDMDIHSYDNCDTNYVSVSDGMITGNDTGTMNRFCGGDIPTMQTSQGSTMTVKLKTRFARGRGFRAVFSSSPSSCGGDFNAISGSFASPGFPDSYPAGLECVWTISTSVGNAFSLSFPDFSLQPYGGFNNDYLEIRSPDVNGQNMGRYFGDNAPGNLTTVRHGAWIKFRSVLFFYVHSL